MAPDQKLPLEQLLIVSVCRCAQPFALASLLTYLPSFISHLSIPQLQVATWLGLLMATLSLCESSSAVYFTKLADRIGRKPVILYALLAQLTGNLCLGFCTQKWQAFFCVIVIGVANGSVPVMRTIVAELVVTKEQQARAFSFTISSATAGHILGSVVGGSLAGVQISQRWSFVLPSAVAAGIFLPGLVLAAWRLEETSQLSQGYEEVPSSTPPTSPGKVSTSSDSDTEHEDDIPKSLEASSMLAKEGDAPLPTPSPKKPSLLSNRFIYLNAIKALHATGFNHMLPVFLQLPIAASSPGSLLRFNHGLGQNSQFTGLLFTAAALVGILTSTFVYPWLAKHYQHMNMLKIAMIAFPIIYLLFPLTALPTSGTLRITLVVSIFLVKGAAFVVAMQGGMVLMTDVARKTGDISRVHGINFMVCGLCRALGSVSSGFLFTAGLTSGVLVLPFWVMAVWALVGVAVAFLGDGQQKEEDVERA